jgi:flavorubredoxin
VLHASIHGNTAKAAEELAQMIRDAGEERVVVADLCREDLAECVEDAFRHDRMILCCATYDGGAFVPMEDFLHHLQIKGYRNRTVGLVENGSWAPQAAKSMRAYLESMKDINILEETVSIKSSMKESDKPAMQALAQAIFNAGQ